MHDPQQEPYCHVCGEMILYVPNIIAGDTSAPLCDKCFCLRIDPVLDYDDCHEGELDEQDFAFMDFLDELKRNTDGCEE